MVEASLGIGDFTDSVTDDYGRLGTSDSLDGYAVEAFLIRTYGVDTGGWQLGGRLSFALSWSVGDLLPDWLAP